MDGVPVRNDSEMLTWGVGTLIESSQVEVPFQVLQSASFDRLLGIDTFTIAGFAVSLSISSILN